MSERVPKPRHTLNVALALLAFAFSLSTFSLPQPLPHGRRSQSSVPMAPF